jgi:hypothetical protein
MTVGRGKRPRDINQLAKWIVDQSVREAPQLTDANTVPTELSAYMAKIGREGGKIGGKRRLATMTKVERSKAAKKAAKARWKKSKRDV